MASGTKRENMEYCDNIMKGVRKGCPLPPILFNLFINDIFNDFSEFGIPLGESRCCGGLFADDIVLFASSRTKLGC